MYGSCAYKNREFDSITVCGSAIFNKVTVHQGTTINGNLQANTSSLTALTVNGRAELSDSSIQGKTKINGFLLADHTKFNEEISCYSQRIVLSACLTSSITVREDGGYHETQVIELKDGTKVNGSIEFKSGNGEIWLFAGSEITGEVLGAKIIKK